MSIRWYRTRPCLEADAEAVCRASRQRVGQQWLSRHCLRLLPTARVQKVQQARNRLGLSMFGYRIDVPMWKGANGHWRPRYLFDCRDRQFGRQLVWSCNDGRT
jgi:hypothetical protein